MKKIRKKYRKLLYKRKKITNFKTCTRSICQGTSISGKHPVEIFLEVSVRCNLSCIMCAGTFDERFRKFRNQQVNEDSAGIMDTTFFYKLKKLFPGVVRVYLMGNGEPLLNPWLLDMIAILKSYGVWVTFNTNGMLLDEKIMESIVKSGQDEIVVSLDAASPGLLEKIRRGADFNKILTNLELLNRFKRMANSLKPHLIVSCVAMKSNSCDFRNLVKLASEVGACRIHFEPLIYQDDPSYLKFYNEESLTTTLPEIELTKVFQDVAEIGRNLNLEIGNPFKTWNRKPEICRRPWTTAFITWDGHVRACCESEENLGDLGSDTMDSIWRNTEFGNLRMSIASKKPPPGCNNCIKNNRDTSDTAPLFDLIQKI